MDYPLAQSSTTKAVGILETAEEISLPLATTTATAYRPSHLLRKSLSSRRLQGRLPIASAPPSENNLLNTTTTTTNNNNSTTTTANVPFEDYLTYRAQESSASEILEKCVLWLETERQRRARRKHHKHAPDNSADESLDLLEAVLLQRPTQPRSAAEPRGQSRRGSRRKSLIGSSSDTEYASDGDAVVPACEEWLKIPEEIGMDSFKQEVLKLAHTLRCKGWRRVDLSRFREVGVSRISGALTNAVYMVTPPADVPASTSTANLSQSSRQPPKLLLRIYGPQVSHLIDRHTELCILRRLARQKIGPRLLGTFENGRFEEFFIARTLTKEDIRVPDTSRNIAKRLKELHEGIDLEPQEREQGPIVWKNWEKWVPRCADVMSHIDPHRADRVCGTTWEVFRGAVEKYRAWLVAHHGGEAALKRELVFAHNDTQYGNILRLQAEETSPLLLPRNEHRQLVVIDFEYASANTPGFEFANHFCEWMADYHDEAEPWRMRELRFPTDGEMRNFLRGYVEHSLHGPREAQHQQHFNLDAGAPADAVGKPEQEHKDDVEREVDRLLAETRAWRAASSAMWAAWGIVQAKFSPEAGSEVIKMPTDGVQDEEFDYLLYAQQRALLFWGDCLCLGVFTPDEVDALEKGLVDRVKLTLLD